MSDADQAQAEMTNDQTVSDPLDTESTQIGTSELADYEQEMRDFDPTAQAEEQGEEPASEEQVEEQTPENESEQAEENSAEESGDESEAQAREQMRPRLKDPIDIAVASLAKAKGISLIEAAKIVEGTQQTGKSEANEAGNEPDQSEASISIEAQLKELRDKYKEATVALEFETAAEIFEQIEALRDKQVELKVVEIQTKAQNEQKQAQELTRAFDDSMRKAATFYPDSVKQGTPLFQKMQEIDSWMEKNGDPMFNHPEKPMTIAKMAAAELGIPMTRPVTATPAKAKPTSKSPIEPAGGNARTAPANPAKRISEEVDALESLDDFEAYAASM